MSFQGLEIKWTKVAEGKSEYLFLSLSNQEDRDNLYCNLLKQSQVNLETIPQNQMTMQWQNGAISNFDYLLYINRYFFVQSYSFSKILRRYIEKNFVEISFKIF